MGQGGGAGEVVVVDVGIGDQRDVDPCLLGGPLDRGQVTRRVDDQAPSSVVDQVAAVPELGYLDGDDLHAHSPE